jgi:hypothetical protein
MEGIALRWENEAKTKAERILNASLNASKEVMGKLLQDSVSVMANSVRKEIDLSLMQVRKPVKEAKKIAIFNIVAAAITFLAVGIVLWLTFFH